MHGRHRFTHSIERRTQGKAEHLAARIDRLGRQRLENQVAAIAEILKMIADEKTFRAHGELPHLLLDDVGTRDPGVADGRLHAAAVRGHEDHLVILVHRLENIAELAALIHVRHPFVEHVEHGDQADAAHPLLVHALPGEGGQRGDDHTVVKRLLGQALLIDEEALFEDLTQTFGNLLHVGPIQVLGEIFGDVEGNQDVFPVFLDLIEKGFQLDKGGGQVVVLDDDI